MIKDSLQRLGAGLAAIILAAFAGGVAFVALAYALFALLQRYVSTAGASAITAGVFALVAAALALLVPKTAPRKKELVAARPKLDPATMRLATEAGVAALGLVGDIALSRRLKREEKVLKTKRRKR
jgi:hypothetical protein